MSKYINRYSFFIVKARRQGTERWINICDDKLLCVKGNTPQAKYNSIRIHHGFGQHEFKFEPKSGAYAMGRLGEDAYVLRVHEQEYRFSEGEYDMFFNAARVRLGVETLSNPEWIIGEAPVANGEIDWIQDSVGSDGGSKTEWGNRKTEYYVRLQNRSGTEYYAMTEPVAESRIKKRSPRLSGKTKSFIQKNQRTSLETSRMLSINTCLMPTETGLASGSTWKSVELNVSAAAAAAAERLEIT